MLRLSLAFIFNLNFDQSGDLSASEIEHFLFTLPNSTKTDLTPFSSEISFIVSNLHFCLQTPFKPHINYWGRFQLEI